MTGTASVLDLVYGFGFGLNDNGNVLTIQNEKDETSTRDQTFTYDTMNRLATAQTPTAWGVSFLYDAWGNLYQGNQIGTEVNPMPLNTSAMANNQLLGYGYDIAGNLINDGGTHSCLGATAYQYDAENRMTCAAGYNFTYDGDGTRVSKSSGTMYWGAGLAESDSAGNLTAEYIMLNGRRIARRDLPSGVVHYYFSDHLGSSNIVASQTGVIENESDYYPYGGEHIVVQNLPNQHFKFTGKERDTESNLDYFGARYFGSTMGRFISPDTVNVTEERMMNPSSTLNKYAYGGNSPLKYIDPDGKDITIFYEAANIFQSAPSPGHTMLLAYNQQTGDSAVRSFGPDHSAPGFSYPGTVSGEAGTDSFGFENIKSPDDLRANFASITIQTTPEEAQAVINEIRAHPDGNYTILSHNCTTTCSKLLRSIGKTKSHAASPGGLFDSLYHTYVAPYHFGPYPNGSTYGSLRPGYNPFQLFFNDIHCTTVTSTVKDSDGNILSSSSSTKCN